MTHGAVSSAFFFSGKASLYEAAMAIPLRHMLLGFAMDKPKTENKETHLKALVSRYFWAGVKSDKETTRLPWNFSDDAAHTEKRFAKHQACFEQLVERLAGILKKRGNQDGQR